MLQLSRVLLSGFGHRTAHFPGTILDFRNRDGLTAKSAVMFAENGRGKTSALSAILHVFQPAKADFVQTLQKDGNHVLNDYYTPNMPCFIILELTRKTGGLIQSQDPALVVGICANKKPDNTYEEEFFLALAHEVPFDSLPMVKAAMENRGLGWRKQDSDAFIKSLRDRHATNQIEFKYTRTQREWLAILESHGLKPVYFRNMVQMARKEGGVDVFLKGDTSEQVLTSIFSMVFAEDAHEDAISAIHSYLHDNKTLPDEMRRRDVLRELLQHETTFIEAFGSYRQSHDALMASSAHLKGVKVALQERADAAVSLINAATARLSEIDTSLAVALAGKTDAEVRAEAVRLTHVRRKLAEALRDIGDTERKLHHYRLVNAVIRGPAGVQRRLAAARETSSSLEIAFRNLTSKAMSRRAPVDQAGSQLAAVLRREIAAAAGRIAEADSRVDAAASRVNATQALAVEADRARIEAEGALTRYREADAAISELLSGAVDEGLLPAPMPNAIDEAAKVIRDAISHLQSDKERVLAEQAGNDGAIRAEEAERRLLVRTRETQTDLLRDIITKLERLQQIQWDLESEFASVLEVSADTDLSDRRIHGGLSDIVAKSGPLLRDKTTQRDAARHRRTALDNAGAFEDPDVAIVLEKCRELGVDAEPFGRWLSDNHADADVARSIVENNLANALGIRVFSIADLDKIAVSFDRGSWGLSKPVAVTLIDADIELHLASGTVSATRNIVLSAKTDYGYNAASLAKHKSTYDHKIAALDAEVAALEMTVSRGHMALGLLSECERLFDGRTKADLLDAEQRAAADIAAVETEIRQRGDTIAKLREAMTTVSERIAEIDAEIRVNKSADASITRLRREVDREAGKRGDMSDDSLGADVVRRTRNHAEARNALLAAENVLRRESEHLEMQKDDARKLEQVLEGIRYKLENEGTVDCGVTSLETANALYTRMVNQYETDMSDDDRVREAQIQLKSAVDRAREIEDEMERSVGRTVSHDFTRKQVEEQLLSLEGKSEMDETQLLHIADEAVRSHQDALDALKTAVASLAHRDTIQVPKGASSSRIEEVIGSLETVTDLHGFEMTAADDVTSADSRIEKLTAERDELTHVRIGRETELASLKPSIDRIADRGDFSTVVAVDVSLEGVSDLQTFIASAIQTYGGIQKQHSAARGKAARSSETVCDYVNADRGRSIPQSFVTQYEHVRGNPDAHGKITHGLAGEIDNYIGNILIGIDRTARAREERILGLTWLVDTAKRKILQAVKVRIPKGRSSFSGREIMKLPTGLDTAALEAVSSREVAAIYLDKLIANPQAANFTKLSQLLVRLLGLIAEMKGIGTFDVRVLKTVAQTSEVTYDSIHKLTGSGGQTITTALLINLLATKIASDELDGDDGGQGFIILDNPSGQSNSKNLVDTQLEVAAEFGIQMITTTGINDYFLTSYDWIIEFNSNPGPNRRNEVSVTYPDMEVTTNLWEFRDAMMEETISAEEAA